ncbi:hypothetical protein T265_02590 [Opisthorchis viverrini]|uniref:Uncharacterized protein n=1 Tax=Opisthorchis viverrini TaxID=6198 RepID=A0A075A6C8_OPIVI|nr:hypothetical protein T265_02590 [Opisthorchis viverrini]KER31150.1 hypothetical protein T265_02590 [Opisthorchis viverrini]
MVGAACQQSPYFVHIPDFIAFKNLRRLKIRWYHIYLYLDVEMGSRVGLSKDKNSEEMRTSCLRVSQIMFELTDREVHALNSPSASRLLLSRFRQPGLMLPSGNMTATHRKGVTAE